MIGCKCLSGRWPFWYGIVLDYVGGLLTEGVAGGHVDRKGGGTGCIRVLLNVCGQCLQRRGWGMGD
jgi:hypothetical protein